MTTATAKQEIEKGHAAHTQAADNPEGLPGKITRPLKITFMGAGSNFCPRLCNDIMKIPTADRGEIHLVDIDPRRLSIMQDLVNKVVVKNGRSEGWTVNATTDRREALPGSDYIVSCIEVSGTSCVEHDNDIPLKYGVDQCIGDTIGPGGLFKALRTVPVFLDVLRDARELCPQAWVLNYTNPMNILCLASARAVPEMTVVGLCHSVQGTSHRLAEYAGVPYAEMEWECAGINHLAWFTKLKHKGVDLYESVLNEKFKREIAQGIAEFERGLVQNDHTDTTHRMKDKVDVQYKMLDLIRKDMCVHFGGFITESSGHLSEYLPYYRKSEAGRKLLRLAYDGGSRFYASNWPTWRKHHDEDRIAMAQGEKSIDWERSWEYASWIIEAREKDQPFRMHGNIANFDAHGQGPVISNLPHDGCVEVACMVDRNGIHPTRFGALPLQMAAICRMNMNMFDLAAKACVEMDREAAIHALMLDPLTAAVLTPGEIRSMGNEMFEAEASFLKGFAGC
ncbi:MAG: alpha-glucosidase/alpha-galactosidase [Phycisphaeraceae bacterium]|nr:alpha-glucosidase/alpha-galactosidase [Phycisphaeraceae bacterium]